MTQHRPGVKMVDGGKDPATRCKILYKSWRILSWNTNLIFVFATIFRDQIQSPINKKNWLPDTKFDPGKSIAKKKIK